MYYELLLPPGIKGFTKNKLWKVKDILENSCSWNSQTYDILEFQEHLYPRAPFNFHLQKGVP